MMIGLNFQKQAEVSLLERGNTKRSFCRNINRGVSFHNPEGHTPDPSQEGKRDLNQPNTNAKP